MRQWHQWLPVQEKELRVVHHRSFLRVPLVVQLVWMSWSLQERASPVVQEMLVGPWAGGRSVYRRQTNGEVPALVVMHTMKPFSSILYDSMVLSSCKILPGPPISNRLTRQQLLCEEHTRIDQFLR